MRVCLLFLLLGCAYGAPKDRHVSDYSRKHKENCATGVGCGVGSSGLLNSDSNDGHIKGFNSKMQDNTAYGLEFQKSAKDSEDHTSAAFMQSSSDSVLDNQQTLAYGTHDQVPNYRQIQDSRRSRKRIVVASPPPCQRRPGVLCTSDVYEFVLYGDNARTSR